MAMVAFDLSGRVALVSGAGQNIGQAIALGLAEVGADLLICDINGEHLEKTADTIAKLGRRVVPVTCDLFDLEQVPTLFARLDREFGRIDVLANIPGGGPRARPEDMSVGDFQQSLNQLLVWKFLACREGGRRMLRAGKGSIINMASIAGVSALGRSVFAYSVAMAGVIQMTRELSTEWCGRGVRVNALAPAQITNPSFERAMDATPGLRENFLRGIPMGRLGVPDDVKWLAVYLASDASAFTTGTVIPIDGGNLAMNPVGVPGNRTLGPPTRA
jgi:NAD(P)-dependent dehydrogenase (short-subunit alcohol dehydrogenase family)